VRRGRLRGRHRRAAVEDLDVDRAFGRALGTKSGTEDCSPRTTSDIQSAVGGLDVDRSAVGGDARDVQHRGALQGAGGEAGLVADAAGGLGLSHAVADVEGLRGRSFIGDGDGVEDTYADGGPRACASGDRKGKVFRFLEDKVISHFAESLSEM
jgi:hypothetical protein